MQEPGGWVFSIPALHLAFFKVKLRVLCLDISPLDMYFPSHVGKSCIYGIICAAALLSL